MAEKVASAGVKKEGGYLYFVDKQGDVSRAKMSRGGRKIGSVPTEIVAKGNRTKYRQLINELNSKYKKKLNRSNYELGKPAAVVAGAFQMPIVPKITPMLAKNFSKGEGKLAILR